MRVFLLKAGKPVAPATLDQWECALAKSGTMMLLLDARCKALHIW
jgi:hypothetical protein